LKRLALALLLLLLVFTILPLQAPAHAQGAPKINVKSTYTLDRYGSAIIAEKVSFQNNGTSPVSAPSLTFGFGNITSKIVQSNLTGTGFTYTNSSLGGPFTVRGTGSIPGGGNSTYTLSFLLNGVVSKAKNGSLQVFMVTSPSIGSRVDKLSNSVVLPPSTTLRSFPPKMASNITGTVTSYISSASGSIPSAATAVRAVKTFVAEDFHPLRVYYAQRMIGADANGNPLVIEKVKFQNMGETPLSLLVVSILAPSTTKLTVWTILQPRLINPVITTLSSGGIPLSSLAAGYPSNGVPAGTNFTITYQYPLGTKYYSVSGGQVNTNIPQSPPLRAFIDSYTIGLSLPQGARQVQSSAVSSSANPWSSGNVKLAYALSIGWAVDAGVPAVSIVFVALLVGLFASRTTTAEVEEAEEEESSTELASTMIKAFDEKTNLINGLWPEIDAKDPNELDKAYFDGLRGRLDSFRSRALQRLNEVRQKSASQRFSEVVNQIQATEREVDRAAKDKLNLYQQYHLRQMRKEVYDRLLPQYTKRLERALNQLSDELHTVQREAKLL
jgi:hypothetical protein